MIEAGQLNRRVTIVDPPTLTPDGIGGFTETAGKSRIVWASVGEGGKQGISPEREILNFGSKETIALFNFTFRHGSAYYLTKKHKLIYLNRTFKIHAIVDPLEANVMIKVTAYEPRD